MKLSREVLFTGLFLSTLTFIDCSNEFVPEGLYDYQVSRLLSNDSNKLWTVTEIIVADQLLSIQNCEDSLFILFTKSSDSLFIQSLRRNCLTNNDLDTLDIGQAAPSSRGITFTDSLVFSDGKVWFISNITSVNSDLHFIDNNLPVAYTLKANNTK